MAVEQGAVFLVFPALWVSTGFRCIARVEFAAARALDYLGSQQAWPRFALTDPLWPQCFGRRITI
jgi:hypothetical protein